MIPFLSHNVRIALGIVLLLIGIGLLIRAYSKRDKFYRATEKLKRALAKCKIATQNLVEQMNYLKQTDKIEENELKIYDGMKTKFENSLDTLEEEGLISGKKIAEFTEQVIKDIKIFRIALSTGDSLSSDSLKRFQDIIIQTMSKLDMLTQHSRWSKTTIKKK